MQRHVIAQIHLEFAWLTEEKCWLIVGRRQASGRSMREVGRVKVHATPALFDDRIAELVGLCADAIERMDDSLPF